MGSFPREQASFCAGAFAASRFAEAPQQCAHTSQRPTAVPLLNSGQVSVGFLRKQSGLVSWGPKEGKSSGCEGPPASCSLGFGGGGSDLMRLVCGFSTLRLFKASLKISGCCYYMSRRRKCWPGAHSQGSYYVAAPGAGWVHAWPRRT